MVSSSRARAVAVIAAAVVASAGGVVISGRSDPNPQQSQGGGGGPATANLWVDANGGTCSFNAAPVAYTGTGDSTSCATTSAAYTAADSATASTSTVAIRTGSYGAQTIPDSARTGGDVTFVEDGGDVTFASLDVNGDKTAWVGQTITNGLSTTAGATRMKGATFTGVSAQGDPGVNAWYISNAQDLVFQNGELCCGESIASTIREAIRTAGSSSAATAVANLTIDGNNIHDWDRDVSATHSECALLVAVQGLTVKNNHFSKCTVYSISIARIGGDIDPVNTLIENNVFEPSDDLVPGDQAGSSNMVLDHVTVRFDGLTIRNNSFSQPIEINTADVPDATGYDRTFIYSNILPGQTSCVPAGMTSPTYAYNVMTTGATCGTNATAVAAPSSLYLSRVTPGAWNFHLSSGSAAIGAASSTAGQFSTTDLGGFPRDGAPDAGAYEFGSGS